MQTELQRMFDTVTGAKPFDYQRRVGDALNAGSNILLRAPTGAGKTLSVLMPFFAEHLQGRGPRRLIYALPLRTLVEAIAREAERVVRALGVEAKVTTQTGQQPDDPFFTNGDVIVTTYDQVLSGLLCGPYGLSDRLANVNGAAVAGNLVVFDEFHLMEPARAFLTATAMLSAFGDWSQSVWMTATSTSPLCMEIEAAVHAVRIELSPEELSTLPSVAGVQRLLRIEGAPVRAEDIVAHGPARSIVLFNTVARAQEFFASLRAHPDAPNESLLLHSRFFRTDRKRKEATLAQLFGKTLAAPAVLVSTQVIEAGVDFTCDHLHTEIAPISALVQRAGRCARFASATPGDVVRGVVHVHPLPDTQRRELPYSGDAILRASEILRDHVGTQMTPDRVATWVERAHGGEDALATRETTPTRRRRCLEIAAHNVTRRDKQRVSDLIRGGDDSVRILVADNPPDSPGALEGLSLRRSSIRSWLQGASERGLPCGWAYSVDERGDAGWAPLTAADLGTCYLVCLPPSAAGYDSDFGLRLGEEGQGVSPPTTPAPRTGHKPLRVESWAEHTAGVARHCEGRVAEDARPGSPLARAAPGFQALAAAARAAGILHDVGKLRRSWQEWAYAAQRSRNPSWVGSVALAHTDYDPDRAEDRARERAVMPRRPPHAAMSACAGAAWVAQLLPALVLTEASQAQIASAVVAAALSHHGSWLGETLAVEPLIEDWSRELARFAPVPATMQTFVAGMPTNNRLRDGLDKLLDVSTHPDHIEQRWALVVYLMRTLRLSDQRATSEASCEGC